MRTCKSPECSVDLDSTDKAPQARYCSEPCRRRTYYLNNRDKEIRDASKYTLENYDQYIVNKLKVRAKKKNVPYSLTVDDLDIPTHCPVLGIPLERSKGCHGPNSPSVDRLIPEKGYTSDNVRVVSYRANRMKNDATLDELQALVSWLEEELGEAA